MVGVEQDQLDAADRHQPDAGRDVAIGDRHVDGIGCLDGTELLGFVALVALDLVAVGDVLAEEALAVEQPDSDERDGEVVRRLDVIAGEDAETAGVLGHELGDPELGREVGDLRLAAGVPCVVSDSSGALDDVDHVAVGEQRVEAVVVERGDGGDRMVDTFAARLSNSSRSSIVHVQTWLLARVARASRRELRSKRCSDERPTGRSGGRVRWSGNDSGAVFTALHVESRPVRILIRVPTPWRSGPCCGVARRGRGWSC